MQASPPQSYANHRRVVPMYHFVASSLLLLNAGYAVWSLVRGFDTGHLIQLTTAVALVIVYLYARIFPIAVQDRLIRLEERLRMEKVLPDDLRGRIDEFTVSQLVALRFASDAELPRLARRVLDEGIGDREAIKRSITEWREDHCRV